ncbi:MAG TPA: AmmeMemoRadiSam system radical SAM enzyme [Candidatus Hydrogenedentes bacterium]|nr:AmmeMemoRadiSam system radical SAM enzyme [Candidatus Hydrogenedentota bacterium]
MPQDNNKSSGKEKGLFPGPVARAAQALYRLEGDVAQCLACAHQCRIKPGRGGVCGVRLNRDGVLYAPDGYVAGLQVDPIEKKPFYHVLPGANALSFGMLGCNFHCDFCQNWISSQMPRAEEQVSGIRAVSADRIVNTAREQDAPIIVSTYNEPLITADWAARIFEKAKEHNLLCGFVSNGFASEEVVRFLRPVMDLFKIDLKCFTDDGYRSLGGRLQPVLDAIERAVAAGFWVEVVTLVVPEFNDSARELSGIATFIAGVSPDIPWHVTAFYPTYKMTDRGPTALRQLDRAYDAGKSAGLRYVYAGNMAGRVANREHTYCHHCNALLIERVGFHVQKNRLDNGKCPECGAAIPGKWTS